MLKKFDSKKLIAEKIERYASDPRFTKDKMLLSISGEIGAMRRYGNSSVAQELEDFRKIIRKMNGR